MFFTKSCQGRGVIMRKSSMKLVRRSVGDPMGTRRYRDWYCRWCTPGHDRVERWNCTTFYYRDSVECDADGNLLESGGAE
ncbi:hypothetical protein LCGC14_1808430 [marine sediment metagenome]|uniref:Uncharacterized protein n=1 Tax=marine sediment metagenome TaxID=412755 RepID=A0A0F9HAJ7_9ZZZZ